MCTPKPSTSSVMPTVEQKFFVRVPEPEQELGKVLQRRPGCACRRDRRCTLNGSNMKICPREKRERVSRYLQPTFPARSLGAKRLQTEINLQFRLFRGQRCVGAPAAALAISLNSLWVDAIGMGIHFCGKAPGRCSTLSTGMGTPVARRRLSGEGKQEDSCVVAPAPRTSELR